MHAAIASHQAAIEAACRRFGVRRLEVFGSASTEAFDPNRSDVDLLVQFGTQGASDPLGEYFGLKAELEHVLGRPVDLLMEGGVRNPFVLAGINATRRLVYAA